jgi:3,4-dihydroxy 2-butanone 4-phosphate synthase/GTP cyclohydrolase II
MTKEQTATVKHLVPGWRNRVERAVAALRAGQLIIVSDDADRENEGDLILAAEDVTMQSMALMVRHTTGIVCVPMSGERLDELDIDLMVNDNTETHRTAFTISVDLAGTTTGVSAAERAATVRALADPQSTRTDFTRPGHVFPLRARPGGVLKRAGHTEAAVDLMRLAGKQPAAVISEIVNEDGSMARADDLIAFAARHDLVTLAIADLIRYRRATERLVERSGSAQLPTDHGAFEAIAFASQLDGVEHLALVHGDVTDAARIAAGVLVRVHSECLTGDVLGSQRCDCGTQLKRAMEAIVTEGCGVLIYLRGHEGRGIGLGHKLRAYALQEQGVDTVDANLALGLPVDSREYGIGAQMLADLGVHRIRLITNNPVKYGGLDGYDIEIVERVAQPSVVTAHNLEYLRTKRDRMGHVLDVESRMSR